MANEFKIKNGLVVSGDAAISGAATVNGNSVIHTGNIGSFAITSLTDTLATVTGRGATTTNAITVGGLTVATNLLYTDTVNGRIGIGTTTPTQRVEVVSFDATIRMGAGFLNSTPAITLINSGASTYKAASLFTGQSYSGFLFDNSGTMRFGSAAKTAFTSNLVANGSETYIMTLVGATSNVLIGTTTDSGYKLDVNGIFRLGLAGGQLYSTAGNTLQANFGNAQFAVGSSGGESIDLSANSTGEIRFGTASTQRMVIKNSGNIGIGTTSPADPLHIATSGADKFIRIENSNSYTGLWLNDSGTNSGWLVLSGYTNASSPGDFAIREYGVQTALTIKQTTGNVGIGTTSPDSRLTIQGSLSAAAQAMENIVTLRRGFNSGIAFEAAAAFALGRNLGDLQTRLDFVLDNANSAAYEYNATILTMLSGGNVGIGSTNPSERLEVNGSIRLSDGNADGPQLKLASAGYSDWNIDNYNGSLRAYYGGTEYTRLTSSGNFGIGTDQPVGQLNVFGGTGNNPAILTLQSQSGGGGNTGIYFRPYQNITFANTAPAQATILAVDASYSAHITFSTKVPGSGTNSLVERMRLTSTGSLVIGSTSSTGEALQVTGSIKSTALSTNGPVVSSGGVLTSVNGYTGMVTIQQPVPMPPITFDIQNGIIVNVM